MDLEQHEQKYTSELDTALQQYHYLEEQAQNVDITELKETRSSLRQDKEKATAQKLQEVYAGQFDPAIMSAAKQDVSELMNDKIERHSVLEFIRKPTEIFVAEKEKSERQPESDR